MKESKDDFDYWKELYRTFGITIYLRKPLSPAVFATKSIGDLTDAGVYELRGLRIKLLAMTKDRSEILFNLFDREGKNIYGKVEIGQTLDELIFKSAYYLEEQRDLRVLGMYGTNVSVEIPNHVIGSAALSWRKIQGSNDYFKIIHLFPKQSQGNVKIETFELPALA